MPLSLAAIDALLADNTSGDISAADMRTIVRALHRKNVGPYSVDDAVDIWWEGDLAGLSTVTVTGSQTITETDGFLSVQFTGQSASDVNAVLKAHTFSVGDSFATRMTMVGIGPQMMVDLIFTDGTTAGSNVVAAQQYNDGTSYLSVWTGTLTSVGGPSWNQSVITAGGTYTEMYVKLTYVSSNTFRAEWSADGVSWTTLGKTDPTHTMTPTHFGVGWSKWGSAGVGAATFGPICKLA